MIQGLCIRHSAETTYDSEYAKHTRTHEGIIKCSHMDVRTSLLSDNYTP